MVLAAVKAVPAGSKPPAAVSVRISTAERHSFGAAALLSTKTSSLRGRAGGSAVMPKLVELVELHEPFSRTAIPMHHLICWSVLITVASLLVSW